MISPTSHASMRGSNKMSSLAQVRVFFKFIKCFAIFQTVALMDRAQCLEAYSLFRPAALPKNVPYTVLRLFYGEGHVILSRWVISSRCLSKATTRMQLLQAMTQFSMLFHAIYTTETRWWGSIAVNGNVTHCITVLYL